MHLLIAHASTLSPACVETLSHLELPHLAAVLARLAPAARDDGDELDWTLPHERALAAALGWQDERDALPWGARLAAQDGIDPGDAAWGLVTPVHWHLARDHVSLVDPVLLALTADESRALLDAVGGLFRDDGWRLVPGAAPLRWYASHASLRALACPSIDRAVGRNVDSWLGDARDDVRWRAIRRLQNEVQMLLHDHPVNEAREMRGALPVNSFWLSGCGVHQPDRAAPGLVVDASLRGPALAGDWAAWADAWRVLDAGPVKVLLDAARRGEASALTLCGERSAQRFEAAAPRPWWRRLTQGLTPAAAVAPVLEAL